MLVEDLTRTFLPSAGRGGVEIVYDALDNDTRALEKIGRASAGAVSSLVVGNFFTDGVGGDIAALNSSSGNIEIYKHKPTSTSNSNYSASFALYRGAHEGLAITTGNYNDDGYQDLAMASSSGNIIIYLQTYQNQGFYSNDNFDITVETSFLPSQIASGDLNDDGLDDIIASRGDMPLASAYLSRGDELIHTFDLTTGCKATGLMVGDLNGDGRKDVAVASAGVEEPQHVVPEQPRSHGSGNRSRQRILTMISSHGIGTSGTAPRPPPRTRFTFTTSRATLRRSTPLP